MSLDDDGLSAIPKRDELIALVREWVCAARRGESSHGSITVPAFADLRDPACLTIPEELASTITSREPWRAQALDDARHFLSYSTFFGIGMEILLRMDLRTTAFEQWETSIAPLVYRIEWSRDMTGKTIDFCDGTLGRVAIEQGSWRIVEFWDGATREANLRTEELLLEHFKARAEQKRREQPTVLERTRSLLFRVFHRR